MEIPRNEKNQEELFFSKKGWCAILLHINHFVAYAMNNTKICNNNLYNT